MNRRHFIATAGVALSAQTAPAKPMLCIFSKHLADLNYKQIGEFSKKTGFDGVDLAVRPGGHVLPEKVAHDLPEACDAIRSFGVEVPMITTGLLSAADPAAVPTLQAAGKLKIKYFKTGYSRYKDSDPDKRVQEVRADVRSLIDIGKASGVELGFHNHSGDYVGTAVWDTRAILEGTDPKWAGYYFDPAHATIEGGLFNWVLSTRLALKRLKMVAIKDFYWAKDAKGKWKLTWCALGEGMVDWPAFYAMLAKARYTGPLSLHVEYQTSDEKASIAKDLEFMKKQVAKAYAAS